MSGIKRQSVKNCIDKQIKEHLALHQNTTGRYVFDEARQILMEKVRRFREKVYTMVTDQNYIINEDMVERVQTDFGGDTKARYFSYYILESEKRIIDLYKIERDYNFGLSPEKTFSLLLFKEKMSPKEKGINWGGLAKFITQP